MSSFRIGLAGLGTVGGGVWKTLQSQAEVLRCRTDATFSVTRIAVRNIPKAEVFGAPPHLLTTDWKSVATSPEVDIAVELMGGTEDAYHFIRLALENGKHVVTANKALLAARGRELFHLAQEKQRHLLFEASVAGGIPIIKALREGLVANRIVAIHGIVNGTCNYILTRMSQEGLEYADVLGEAKRLGYAEADESLDVDGHDAAHKTAVLAALAYSYWVPLAQLYTEGIRHVQQRDLRFARQLGYEVKLLCIIRIDEAHAVEARVHPTLIPRRHVLASVGGAFNAISVRGDVVGDTLFYGRGAGAEPTASAVLSDLAELARQPVPPGKCLLSSPDALAVSAKPMSEVISRYYLRLNVIDQPGVLAKVATILAAHAIGISSVIQPEGREGDVIPLIIMLHDAKEGEFKGAVQEIEKLASVKAPAVWLRVEDFE
jgi:homoserine dehydrogenase